MAEKTDNSINSKSRIIVPIIFAAFALIEVNVSAYILLRKFGDITDVNPQIIVHVVIGLFWIINAIIVYKCNWVNRIYVAISIILLLATTYGLFTVYTMTDYVVKSGTYNSTLTLEEFKKGATLKVTSESLKDGRWDTAIAGSGIGNNEIPQLTFDKVDGADSYAIYMLDESAGNWLHWKAFDVKTNTIKQGEEMPLDKCSYSGPYPPAGSGDHTYVIYVYALKQRPDAGYSGEFYETGMDAAKKFEIDLDVADGERGNVLKYGYVEGTFSVD